MSHFKQPLPQILEKFQQTEKTLNEDLEILQNWLVTQKHLPEVPNDNTLTNFLIWSKFSIELCKEKIDMYYTLRTRLPDFFQNANPKLREMQEIMQTVSFGISLNFTSDLNRVIYFNVLNELNESVNQKAIVALSFQILEIRLNEEFIAGDIIIYDMKNITMGSYLKCTPTFLQELVTIYRKVYSIPIKMIVFLNSPPLIHKIIRFVKSLINEKIFDRLYVCEDTSILQQVLPDDFIPSDYGGNSQSTQELYEMVKLKMAEYQARYDQLDTLKVNEDLRPEKLENDDILGYYGNFKQLSFD